MIIDEIISIEELEEGETIDIEVSGDHLFYANDILTHNSNTDFDLTATSDSMGIVHSSDACFGLITSEELESVGQLMIKQLKNRWNDLGYYRRFVVGIDRSKMKLFNLDQSAQNSVSSEDKSKNDQPGFDKGKFSQKWESQSSKKKLFGAENIS